jgi:predicted nuclease with TOPRIM domain
VQRLAEAQARTEERVGRLEEAMQRLAEAQARTEERVGRLEEAVQRLAEAQARTERAVHRLARQVGGLSDAVGGDIEDIGYIVVHDVLERELGWEVGVLERTWVRWDGREVEVNLFGRATDPARPEQAIWIVGEAKHNLTLRDVERFASKVERAQRNLAGEIFPVCFCYRARPEVRDRLGELGIHLVFSYGRMQ